MPEPKAQSFANHTRFHPLFHFIVAPFLLINWIVTLVHLAHHPNFWSVWLMLVAFALILIVVLARTYALKVQDRVIRLEERIRLAAVLHEPLRARIGELSVRQLVGLRFASDAELPALVDRTLRENLTQKQIKQAIQNWRPDYTRV